MIKGGKKREEKERAKKKSMEVCQFLVFFFTIFVLGEYVMTIGRNVEDLGVTFYFL